MKFVQALEAIKPEVGLEESVENDWIIPRRLYRNALNKFVVKRKDRIINLGLMMNADIYIIEKEGG